MWPTATPTKRRALQVVMSDMSACSSMMMTLRLWCNLILATF